MCLYLSGTPSWTFPTMVTHKVVAEAALPSLFHLPYEAKDYSLGENAVPNGHYAVNGHPSDETVASTLVYQPYMSSGGQQFEHLFAEPDDRHVNNDQFKDTDLTPYFHDNAETKDWLILGPDGSPYTERPQLYPDSYFIGAQTQTHLYGYATCENIGTCSQAGQKVGSVCSSAYKWNEYGICYKAADASLQCGSLREDIGRHGTVQKTNGRFKHCPMGTDLSTPGRKVVKRMLYGGCKLPEDYNYSPHFEVHIPELCNASSIAETSTTFEVGCLFPGAVNYAPGAGASGKCLYHVKGCTSPTALNYNSEADRDDPMNPCVEPVQGCTLQTTSYEAVASDTPSYKKLHYGVPLPNVGPVVWPAYGQVKTYDAAANVLNGCVIVIEGCMDPTAINYNSEANTQSSTWCVPPVVGCMMPIPDASPISMNLLAADGATRSHVQDGGSAVFDPAATVNDVTLCMPGRRGCMSPTAENYDSLANIMGECWEPTDGCLDRTAYNFNCTEKKKGDLGYVPCDSDYPRATVHVEALCNFFYSPPPIASPSIPKGAPEQKFLKVELIGAGDVSDYTEAVVTDIRQKFADKLAILIERVLCIITSASVNIEVQILAEDEDELASFETTIAPEVNTISSAQSFLASTGVQVLSAPTIEQTVKVLVGPPSPPPEVPVGAIVGGVVGGLAAVLLIAGAYYMYKKKKAKSATYPA